MRTTPPAPTPSSAMPTSNGRGRNARVTWESVMRHGSTYSGGGAAHGEERDPDDSESDLLPPAAHHRASVTAPAFFPGLALPVSPPPPPVSGPPTSQDRINLEFLRTLRSLRKKGSSSSGSSSSGTASGDSLLGGGRTKGFKGVHALRKAIKKRPGKFVKKYVERMKRRLGVLSERQFWRPADYSKMLMPVFGRMRGLWRCHYMTSEILEHALRQEHEVTCALLCQLLKCLHQVALDRGSWETSQLLWVSEDVLGRDVFGGEEAEMQVVQQFQKARKELLVKQPSAAGADEDNVDGV